MVVELLPAVDVAPGVVHLAPAHGPLVAGLGGHVGLGPDDRGDALGPAGLVEVQDPVHVAVVGDAQRRLPVRHRGGHQLADPGRPVEHGELGVGVEMRKRPPRHRPSFQRSNLQPCYSIANSGPYPVGRMRSTTVFAILSCRVCRFLSQRGKSMSSSQTTPRMTVTVAQDPQELLHQARQRARP